MYTRCNSCILTLPTVRFVLLVAVLTTILCAGSRTSRAQATVQNMAPANTITVQGTGEVRNKPDLARLTLGVQTQNVAADAAARDNATRTDAIIKAVRATGVADVDIQTSDYSINPQQQYEPNKPPIVTGYQVSNTVRVTVRRIADVGKVIDASIKAGANVAGGISFDLNEQNAANARDEALARAVAEANRKANVLARASGIIDLFLIRIVEGGAGVPPPFPVPMSNVRFAAAEVAPTPVQAGELTVTASVTADYRFGSVSVNKK